MAFRSWSFAFLFFLFVIASEVPVSAQVDHREGSMGSSQPPKTVVDDSAGRATPVSLETAELRKIVLAAFEQTHDGWSSDEVVLQEALNEQFIAACEAIKPGVNPADLNWTLINLRKAGLLKIKSTKRDFRPLSEIVPLAEIAARSIFDRYKVSTDRMMCDPELRAEFDQVVASMDADADLYSARKAAFRLRKQRLLRPELVARIADWGREIHSFPLTEVRDNIGRIPALPGVYIFRDQTGYLYIGQADNLNTRINTHLSESHNFSLASYLKDQGNDNITLEIHSFPADSRAKETMVRRAYESELIASRKPRFNIQP